MPASRTTARAVPAILLTALLALTLSSGCGAARAEYSPDQSYQSSRYAVAADGASTGGASGVAVAESAGPRRAKQAISRKFYRTSSLTVEVKDDDDFAPTLERARDTAKGLGGYVQAESTKTMHLKVPTERLQEALKLLGKLGEVKRKHVSVRDVTAQYTDLQIRIANLRKTRERLQQLLQQSKNVKEVLAVEKELNRVTLQLERLEGSMRVMNNRTTYASIHLRLEERVRPGPIGWIFYGAALGIKWLFVWD